MLGLGLGWLVAGLDDVINAIQTPGLGFGVRVRRTWGHALHKAKQLGLDSSHLTIMSKGLSN